MSHFHIAILRQADKQYSSSDGSYYVLKPVCPELLKQAHNINGDLRSSQFVRLSIDSIADEAILVHPHLTEDLMSLLKNHEISPA